MPYRKEQFANDEIYHIILRGLENNIIFNDVNDYYRMIFSIYEFNNANPVEIARRRKERLLFKQQQAIGSVGSPSSAITEEDKRERLVDILAFCWMPNHIHLLLKQLKDEGITKFMRKLGTGYAKYFNQKNNRKGYVFQNRFRSILIKGDDQLKNIFVYIHTNPIALIEPGWKEKGITNLEKAIKFLEEGYRWNSYWDYLGKKNFPSVTERNFMLEVMGGENGCKDFVNNWINYKKEVRDFEDLFLE